MLRGICKSGGVAGLTGAGHFSSVRVTPMPILKEAFTRCPDALKKLAAQAHRGIRKQARREFYERHLSGTDGKSRASGG